MTMSSSFPAARFPALPLRQDGDAADLAHIENTVAAAAEPSDESLIARICADDAEALGLLFCRYARLVWSTGGESSETGKRLTIWCRTFSC